MNPMIVLKLIDLAFLGLSAWERYDAAKSANATNASRLQTLRTKLLLGELDEDQAMIEVDALIADIRERRRAAFQRLPIPTNGVQELDGD